MDVFTMAVFSVDVITDYALLKAFEPVKYTAKSATQCDVKRTVTTDVCNVSSSCVAWYT